MYTSYSSQGLSDDDKKRKRNSLDMDLVMIESENRKSLVEKSSLNAEIRKMGVEQERLKMNIEDKKRELSAIDDKIKQNTDEINKIKRKFNGL